MSAYIAYDINNIGDEKFLILGLDYEKIMLFVICIVGITAHMIRAPWYALSITW